MIQNSNLFPHVHQMDIKDFKLFQEMIYAEAGIYLPEKKITLLSNRIRKRLKALKLESYHKYYLYLMKSVDKEAELINMINVVTTNVTHFFRNPKQFDKLRNIVIPDIIKKNHTHKNLKILSAGCSTGEEQYSIAIVLLEYFKEKLPGWNIVVEGVDIDTEAIKKAKEGIYAKDKIDKIEDFDKKILNKYFKKIDNKFYRIIDKVKSITKFKRFNLKSDNFSSKYDVIFCRNVVIYFDEGTKKIIHQKFHNALNNEGYYLIGHSEGLINDSRFKYQTPGLYIKN